MSLKVEIIPAHQINKEKWDACIDKSNNALIYAHSFYLDHLADNWNGIVVEDYHTVMPIPWRKKMGIKYCYDVPFIQQLGWFQQNGKDQRSFLLQQLYSFCNYGDYAFNFYNLDGLSNTNMCNNYILDLSGQYGTIKQNYAPGFMYSLKKASANEFIYLVGSCREVTELHKDLYSERTKHVSENDFNNFNALCEYLLKGGNVIVRKVNNAKNELLSAILIMKDKGRLYNIMNCTTETGRKSEANYLLFDSIFKEFAGNNFIFDFEGSDIPGVNFFYKKFGAVNQPYQKLHFNHLPFPINVLKR